MPSNVENILNAILTGDGSGIQKPASRVEELLFEIYEQGGGGGGDSVIGGIKLTIDENYVMTATLVDKDREEYGVSDDIDLPLEEMVVDAEYDPQTQKIKLELKNGNYVEFSVAELVSGLQTELSSDNKLNPAYIAYDASHRAVSDTEKNTWNTKQNAISDLEAIRSGASAGATAVQPATMEAALAAKQNSLSETQLAAVNSGINSTKVGQISTNQSNILSVKEYTRRNVLSITDRAFTAGTNNRSAACEIPPLSGKVVVYFGSLTSTDTDSSYCAVGFSDTNGTTITTSSINRGNDVSVTLDLGDSVATSMFIYPGNSWTASAGDSLEYKNGMVIEKELYDHDPSYTGYSAPNYDLTRLEAEDRVSLAEVVDSGAKNLVDWRNTVSFQNITIDNGTYTTSGDTATTLRFQVAAIDSNGGQIMAFNGNGIVPTANGVINIPFTVPSGTAKIRAGHNGSTYNGRFDIPLSGTTLEVGKSYVLQVNVTQYTNSSGIFKWKDLMICTKAAFGVSNKFVPYRPNYDLVCRNILKRKYMNYYPHTLTWTKSLVGKYYSQTLPVDGFSMIYAVTLAYFRGLSESEILEPVVLEAGTAIQFYSNTDTFEDPNIDEIGVVVIGI